MNVDSDDVTTVRRTITVSAPAEHAFRVFTEEMGSWWPPHYHLIPGEYAATHVKPHAGGRVFDVNAEGETSTWGPRDHLGAASSVRVPLAHQNRLGAP